MTVSRDQTGVEPVFLEQHDAIDYATGRACFRSGEIRILDSTGNALAESVRFVVIGRDLHRKPHAIANILD